MKTLIAVPCMDQVATPFCQSLVTLNKVGDCTISFNVGSLISESREHLAAQAIKGEADYVLWFDSDMMFAPDTMKRLMEHMKTADVASGLYFRRRPPFSPVLFRKLEMNGDACIFEDYDDYPTDRAFDVAGIGFGCCLMKTDVLMDMLGKYGTCFSMIGRNGEDVSFSIRAGEMGVRMVCDPSIKCGHVGYNIVTEGFYRSYRESSK